MSIPKKFTQVAENVPKVYEAGKKAEYDAFWDAFQNNGNRTAYSGLFLGCQDDPKQWFKPKYDIVPTNLYAFTYTAGFELFGNIDFAEWFDELGIKFDTSKCTNFQYAFHRGKRYGVIDTSSTTAFSTQVFWQNSRLQTVDELIVHENLTFGTATFQGCTALVNLKVSGTIGKNGFTVQYSPNLSKSSIESIINALSATTTGLTATLSKTAVNNAFSGGADGEEWDALVKTKPNWTISLA